MWKITTVIHLTDVIKVNKNEKNFSPHSCTHYSSLTRTLTSSPSNAPFASPLHFFLSSATPCSTPLFCATDLSPLIAITASPLPSHSLHCSHRVVSLEPPCQQLPRSLANPSRCTPQAFPHGVRTSARFQHLWVLLFTLPPLRTLLHPQLHYRRLVSIFIYF